MDGCLLNVIAYMPQREKFNGPAPLQPEAPLQDVLDGINVILDIFESREFCTKVHAVAVIQVAVHGKCRAFLVRLFSKALNLLVDMRRPPCLPFDHRRPECQAASSLSI